MSQISDFFGIYTALHAVSAVYFRSARKTGRTTRLVMSLKTGDRVIFATSADSHRVLNMARERCIDVECIVIDPLNPVLVHGLERSKGRTIFDHTWIELRHLACIGSEERWLAEFEKRLSATDADITKTVTSWKGIER